MKTVTTSDSVVQLDAARAAKSVDREDLRQRALMVVEEQELSHQALADALEEQKSSVTHFLNGRFDKCTKRIFGKILGWLSVNETEDAKSRPQAEVPRSEPGFVSTATSTRVLDVLAYCHSESDLGCVYGGPGIGKTMAALEYQSRYPNVFIMTGSPEVATVHPMLEDLARSLGLEECVGGSRVISRGCRDRIKAAKKPLLIVDEAQHLNLGALESLRSIHDETKCGLVLMGNTLVYERLTGGTRAAHFAQLFSRLGIQAHIKRPLRQDVIGIASAWGLEDERSIETLTQIARRPGALRAAVKVLRLAVGGADGNVKTVRIEHIRAATRNLGLEIVP